MAGNGASLPAEASFAKAGGLLCLASFNIFHVLQRAAQVKSMNSTIRMRDWTKILIRSGEAHSTIISTPDVTAIAAIGTWKVLEEIILRPTAQ
jgi:hypothetical protein